MTARLRVVPDGTSAEVEALADRLVGHVAEPQRIGRFLAWRVWGRDEARDLAEELLATLTARGVR
ncbi:hypothetical protein [Blastococcus sp. SYSU D00813]